MIRWIKGSKIRKNFIVGFLVSLCIIFSVVYALIENNKSLYTSCDLTMYKDIVETLCSKEFEGRQVGSEGNELATEFMAEKFKEVGLKPFHGDDYYDEYGYTDIYSREIKYKNVIGKLEGEESSKAVVISSHFDHIGANASGQVYQGAIDNASGCAVLLTLAKALNHVSDEVKFKYDILFCAFNGEEAGLLGSNKFIETYSDKYEFLYNINIDCVGYDEGGAMTILQVPFTYEVNEENKALFKSIEEYLSSNHIDIADSPLIGVSDNEAFEEAGITSVGLSEEYIKDVVHTFEDKPEVVNYTKLELITRSIFEFIEDELAYRIGD